jgi:Mlc titration factor MtfA (ptsG expression regulator)
VYYRKLGERNQGKFANRVRQFIEQKSFHGRQHFDLTNEAQILIAASAVQLTFGLDTWDLSYFNTIFVYPGEYQNPQTGRMHKGETNLGGMMCFSWKDFVAGNENPHDKINLGLHEFAHALRFNGVKGDDTDYFFENYFPRWAACASKEFSRMKNNLPSIFRKYGSVNINEFFSVSVETFFEAPQEFKNYFPELYIHTAILLNQYISDEGHIVLDCRDGLIDKVPVKLNGSYTNLFNYNLRSSNAIIMVIGFAVVGLFSLSNQGYLYPSPYICLGIAALSWLVLEKQYTRIFFDGTRFRLTKGFFLLKGYKTIELPIANLISIIGSRNDKSNVNGYHKALNSFTVTYYTDGYFYEEEVSCEADPSAFELLCAELKQQSVHLFIQGSY